MYIAFLGSALHHQSCCSPTWISLLPEFYLSSCDLRGAESKASDQIWISQEHLSHVDIDEQLELNRQVIKACHHFRQLWS